MTKVTITPFLRGYIDAALSSSTDESRPDGGDPLDDNYSVSDLADETIVAMAHECAAFECQAGAVLWSEHVSVDSEQMGHDFWHTRTRSGVGFWEGPSDGYHGNSGEYLTRLSHAYGERWLYVGDDGLIYQSR